MRLYALLTQEENVDEALATTSKNPALKDKIHGFKSSREFMKSLGDEDGRLFVFSITHGGFGGLPERKISPLPKSLTSVFSISCQTLSPF